MGSLQVWLKCNVAHINLFTTIMSIVVPNFVWYLIVTLVFITGNIVGLTAFQPISQFFTRPSKAGGTRSGTLCNSQNSPSIDSSSFTYQPFHQHRDVVIVGGALAGLSAALYLSQMDPSRHITILDRYEYGTPTSKSKHAEPASFAAAGMLAPQSERLPPGKYLDLCLESRRMFPGFCDMVETLARASGEEGSKYLYGNQFRDSADTDLDPWSVGYVGTGGFLAPAFAGDAVATWAPPEGTSATWLDTTQVLELEPGLNPKVVGGWWFPDDASVDARRLTCSLRAACVAAGVQILSGPQFEVSSLDLIDGKCLGLGLQTSKNKTGQRYIKANDILIANGAWMRTLLPVPIEPHKGQSLSLQMPTDRPPILRRVLFAQDSYIVPKADGKIVVGATVEAGSYDPNVTPSGLLHILNHAIQLAPCLKDLPIVETWAGLRPTTPDKGPILGKTPWENLFVAGGYWRNGVLLAPKTGQLLASLIVERGKSDQGTFLSSTDASFLDSFAWNRFTCASGSVTMAANARYAASFYPVHKRSSTGVAAAVGTELGFYSTARAAVEDRKKDRNLLWNVDNSEEDTFEKAALMGKQDAAAYRSGDDPKDSVQDWPSLLQLSDKDVNGSKIMSSSFFEGSADAITVGTSDEGGIDLKNIYKSIRDNKEENQVSFNSEKESNDGNKRADPGFRIFRIDPETGEETEVPPYSSPGVFQKIEKESKSTTSDEKIDTTDLSSIYTSIHKNKSSRGLAMDNSQRKESPTDPGFRIFHVDPATGEERCVPPYTSPGAFLESLSRPSSKNPPNGTVAFEQKQPEVVNAYDETTFDGYQLIMQANARGSREEELLAMKAARHRNRLDDVDLSKVGVKKDDNFEGGTESQY
jgi:thiazole synthase